MIFDFTFNLKSHNICLYIEPSAFLFIGKAAILKFYIHSFIYLSKFVHVLKVCISPLSLFSYKLVYYANINLFNLKFVNINNLKLFSSIKFHDNYSNKKYLGKYFYSLKCLMFKSIFSLNRGWISRLRLAGIGYKLYTFCNLIIFKIGYNKCLFFLLPLDLRIMITGRKKRGFIIFGMNKLLVTTISKILLQLRIPNIYTGKGIRIRGQRFVRKVGKKSLF